MNKLIRYGHQHATLHNLYEMEKTYYLIDDEVVKYFIRFYYMLIDLATDDNSIISKRWTFDTVEERDKVYNYILNTYFTDIEKEINKEVTA